MSIFELISAWNQNNPSFAAASPRVASVLIPKEGEEFYCPFLVTRGVDHQGDLQELSDPKYTRLLRVLHPCTTLRFRTVLAWPRLLEQSNRGNALQKLIMAYKAEYHSQLWPALQSGRPAAWRALSDVDSDLASGFDRCVKENEWHSPGMALLSDTLLELCGKRLNRSQAKIKLPNPWLPGHTWILVSLKSGGEGDPPGLLLRLHIEKIPDGCGALYPHPIFAAHVSITESFSAGIRNAWAVVKNGDATLASCDYRWWVTVVEPPSGGGGSKGEIDLPLARWLVRKKIDGESATLAFAIALKSVIKEITLRKDRATTACFRDTRTADSTFGLGYLQDRADPLLHPVGAISNKEQAILLCQQEGVEINKLVLKKGQKSVWPSKMDVVFVETFDEAYREFSELESFLSDFAKERAGRWRRLVEMGAESEAHDRA